MSITHIQLREKYANFWKSKNHVEVPPIPLIPRDDPTTLFTGSGMQQLVPYLLGEPSPLGKRLYNIQPCFRSQDIEEVGDNRHTTFFEMMGNWSLGDYFKKEQLNWLWQFLTQELLIPKEKLYVTVFSGDKENNLHPDNESLEIWQKLGVLKNNIFTYGVEKNWWSRAGVPNNMPAGEPGGPDSEMFYDFGEELNLHEKSPWKEQKCSPNCDCGRFLEIGNSVFMQYKKGSDGFFTELPAKNVDFGGGLERILMAIQNTPDVFEIDIFKSLYSELKTLVNKDLGRNELYRIRVFLDHSRAAIFLLMSGITPGKNDKQSVLRRVIRRANAHLDLLPILKNKNDIWETTIKHFVKAYQQTYPINFDVVFDAVQKELLTLKDIFVNMKAEKNMFKIVVEKSPNNSTASEAAGPIVFEYQTSYGVPLDYSKLLIEEFNLDETIVIKKYRELMLKHQEISKAGAIKKFKGGLADNNEQTLKYHTTTHLLHQALFDVLGNEVRQEGSNITGERLRFDFYLSRKPTEEEIKKVENIINNKIKEALPVSSKILPKEEALKLQAKSFFREKYPDMVKVYFIADYSKEFCGGPHVSNTKEIGQIKIFRWEKIGNNLYRIYAK